MTWEETRVGCGQNVQELSLAAGHVSGGTPTASATAGAKMPALSVLLSSGFKQHVVLLTVWGSTVLRVLLRVYQHSLCGGQFDGSCQ